MQTAAPHQMRIRLAKPDVGEDEVIAIRRVLESGTLTDGPETQRFEQAFAQRHQAEHAVAFANGTVALAGIYLAFGIGPGDEVIVPSLTFVSTATSVLHVGATPMFADVDAETYNIDAADVARRITAKTRAIVAVHYAGQPADMAELRAIAQSRRVTLIEDAAEAHGATYRGRPVGGLGDAAMFSFTPTKNITTGEGAIVTTGDPDFAGRLRLLRNHGQTAQYEHGSLGFNWRITEMQAAMGCVQLRKLEGILARKDRNASRMESLLGGVAGVILPVTRSDRTHVHMLYTLRVANVARSRLLDALHHRGIEARLYFPPAHRQPVFRHLPLSDLPVTDRLKDELISIPFHSLLTDAELEEIAAVIIETIGVN